MILAAGYGKRLKPITDTIPKPLIEINGTSLLKKHLVNLDNANFSNVTINLSHLGFKICRRFGNKFGKNINIRYSFEPSVPLETAGGIAYAEPWNNSNEPFLVINSDVWSDWNFNNAYKIAQEMKNKKTLACLIMVKNPPNHFGDYLLERNTGLIKSLHTEKKTNKIIEKLTFSGLAIYHPYMFNTVKKGERIALKKIFDLAIAKKSVLGKKYIGNWSDIGTHERLEKLRTEILKRRTNNG